MFLIFSFKSILWYSSRFSKSVVEKKVVPSFLIDKNESQEDLNSLLSGLRLVGDYLDKTILKPNNLSQPLSRLHFINTLK